MRNVWVAAFALSIASHASAKDIDVQHDWVLYGDLSTVTLTLQRSPGDLSGWKDVVCSDNDIAAVVGQIKVFREPAGNADNFIAKLAVECAMISYETDAYTMNGTYPAARFEVAHGAEFQEIFHGEFRRDDPETQVFLPIPYLPIGLQVRTNFSEDYVKTLALYGVTDQNNDTLGPYSNPKRTPELPAYMARTGPTLDLVCPDQKVLVGVGVKYESNKSKIRLMRIYCRTLRKRG